MDGKNSVHMSGILAEGTKLAAQQAMHSQYVLQLLQLQRRAGFLCDITINIQEKSFKAHKPLLAACSLYFRALFANCDNAKTSTLNFEKLSSNGFEVLLDYIYSGSLAITSENSDQVLHAANCLQMTNVVETCLNFVRSSFKVTSGEGEKSGRAPDAVASDLPITLHGSETSRNSQLGSQPQILCTTQQTPPTTNEIASQQIPNGSNPSILQSPTGSQQSAVSKSSTPGYSKQNEVATVSTSQEEHPESTDPLTQTSPIVSPNSETLSMIMPYLVAKNARRPTLNEVRQLLMSGQRIDGMLPENMETTTTDSVRPALPALIPAHTAAGEVQQQGASIDANHVRENVSAQSHADKLLPVRPMLEGIQRQSSVGSNTTSHATVNAGHSIHINSYRLASKDMQPFVVITSENNALTPNNREDLSKGCAWSDDRSVNNDQSKDQRKTHLSGTPCSANLTSSESVLLSPTTHPYPATSPASFGSTPSIEISPASVATTESPSSEVNMSVKMRWARAQSLDFTNLSKGTETVSDSPTKNAEDFRSASLSPKFFRTDSSDRLLSSPPSGSDPSLGDHSALISAEQAANAVGALYVKNKTERKQIESSADDKEDDCENESNLVINEANDQDGSNDEAIGQSKLSDSATCAMDISQPADNSEPEERPSGFVIKQEMGYSSSTSPPPEEPFFPMDQEDALSRSTTPSVATSSSHEGTVDENGVLDLSMQKPLSKASSISKIPHLPEPPGPDVAKETVQGSDQNSREDMEVVSMQSTTPTLTMDAHTFTNPALPADDNPLTVGFSRKPRRSSGGQTCQWPGCGRLFRHRNIYEEHKKLHEMGVPVKQLRRCYMGARVKKTARERLDEMRSVEGASASHQVGDAVNANEVNMIGSGHQRASHKRKRGLAPPGKDGSDRKRVTAKDRKEHLSRNPPWPPQHSSQATIQHTPMYSHASGIPLAVLQSVNSDMPARQASWPLSAQAPPLVNGGIRMGLMNYTNATGPGVPAMLAPVGVRLAATSAGGNPKPASAEHNHSTVVEALTALGIPIPPTSRGGAPGLEVVSPPPRPGIQGAALTSPNSGVALDQLRRSIALRETSENPEVSSDAARIQHRIGNVAGTKFTSDGRAVTLPSGSNTNRTMEPDPNSYRGASTVVQRVAKI